MGEELPHFKTCGSYRRVKREIKLIVFALSKQSGCVASCELAVIRIQRN